MCLRFWKPQSGRRCGTLIDETAIWDNFEAADAVAIKAALGFPENEPLLSRRAEPLSRRHRGDAVSGGKIVACPHCGVAWLRD